MVKKYVLLVQWVIGSISLVMDPLIISTTGVTKDVVCTILSVLNEEEINFSAAFNQFDAI